MGDVLLTTPIVRHLKTIYPDAIIDMMVRPYVKDMVENNADINEVVIYDKYGKQKSFFSTIKFGLDLRHKNYDLFLAFHPTNRAHIIGWAAGIKNRVGYDSNLSFLLNRKITSHKHLGQKHEAEYNFDLLVFADIPSDCKNKVPCISIPAHEDEEIKKTFKSIGIDDKNFLAVHPSASCLSKKWPEDKFVELIDGLNEKYNSDIVLIDDDASKEICSDIASKTKNAVFDLSGQLSLIALGAFLQNAKLLISNDSGPVHLATAVNTPVISIFGRNDPGLSPARWKPLGMRSFYIHKDVGCEFCAAHNCVKGFKCLDAVAAEELMDMIDKIFVENLDR